MRTGNDKLKRGAIAALLLTLAAPVPAADAAHDAEGRLRQALELSGEGRGAEAESMLKDLIEEYPARPEPYNNLAALYAAEGRLEEARAVLEQALRAEPAYAAVYDNLSSLNLSIARRAYARALPLEADERPSLRTVEAMAVEPEPEPEVEPVVVAVAEPKPQPEPEPEPEPQAAAPTPEDEVRAALQTWAAAWSAQNVDGYLAAYAGEFTPREGDREGWAASRRRKLAAPGWIRVELEDWEFKPRGDGMRVMVKQRYTSDRYSDYSRKRFDLRRDAEGAWRIVAERTIAVLKD